MTKVNVLTQGFRSTNGIGFLYPLVFNRLRLRNIGIDLTIYTKKEKALYNCDVLITDSKIYRPYWATDIDFIYNDFKEFKSRVNKVFFYDIQDSTGGLVSKILPYVDKYIKSFTYKDKALYRKEFYGNRIWTDFYHKKFNIVDIFDEDSQYELNDTDLKKICTGYNQAFVDYSLNGKFIVGNFLNEVKRKYFLFNKLKYPSNEDFIPPSIDRKNSISCRIGIGYNRKTVCFQREQIAQLLSKYIQTNKLNREDYFSEMKNSKVVISPFGWGELNTPRDYEVALNGSLLLKPDISHLDTFPNIFTKDTIETFKWDLSDLEIKLNDIENNYEKYIEKAHNFQNVYKHYMTTEEGYYEFCEFFKNLVLN